MEECAPTKTGEHQRYFSVYINKFTNLTFDLGEGFVWNIIEDNRKCWCNCKAHSFPWASLLLNYLFLHFYGQTPAQILAPNEGYWW